MCKTSQGNQGHCPSKTPMTPADASRIQSHADKTGQYQDFKARAQSAAARNTQYGGKKYCS
ncbi:hypothetical protein BDA99DRAFT_563820 [Phascolomyces articulosus]|uniref:Uncharacterized protein n=1 Tax=Phascolomyces articulosus TaxID=60185 RepID=A0AAD5K2A7_9FUNG|nr:hypothetical protein BDA99DRAFT_563820 [Phascolomyces articulosus]